MSTGDKSNSMDELGAKLIQYLPRLVRLAEANMNGRLKQRIDPDEMANSVVGSVIRMQAQGKLSVSIENSEEFGALIITIALNKIRKKARFHGQQKRNPKDEVRLPVDGPSLEELAVQAGDPTEEDGKHLARVLDQLQETLDEDGRIVLSGKQEQLMAEQIAGKLNGGKGRSTKTVQRIWKEIRRLAEEISEKLDV